MTRRFRPRLPLRDWLAILTACVIALGLLWLSNRVGNQGAQLDAFSIALAQQREQATSHGQTPVAPPPEEIRKNPTIVKGLPGEPGKDGARGPAGRDGAPGPSGSPGRPGRDGKDGAIGPSGRPGEPGKDGAPGKDGQDGAPGEDGTDGTDGKDGQDGSPPASWTWAGPFGTYVCRRDEGSPDSAPTYTCTREGSQ